MNAALTIGTASFTSNLIQAPLAGYSCAPFRELAWKFGGLAYACTEMLSAQNLASGYNRSPRYIKQSTTEGPVCWQIAGNTPDILKRATERAIGYGASLIDLNCGCPVPKIRGKRQGSKLLADTQQLATLIKAIHSVSTVPVTVKIRVDGDSGDQFNLDAAQAIQDAGADALIVHGRHWTERYDVPCRYDDIAMIVDTVDIPVIGNGDIENFASLQHMFESTHCAGAMVARASVGQPWLFRQLQSELNGEPFTAPTPLEIGQLFLQHIQGLIEFDGEYNAVLQSRKFAKYYARQLPEKDAFCQAMYQAECFEDASSAVLKYFYISPRPLAGEG